MNRVVITGIGIVSPVGSDLDEFWTALVDGRSGIGPLTIVPTERLSTRIAAQVIGFDPDAHFRPKQAHLLDRFAQFAVFAARAAVRDLQCEISEELALDAATVIGTGSGGQSTVDAGYFKLYGQNSEKVHPLSIPRWMVNAAASQVSIDLGLRGPTWTVATACASGAHAIGQAFHMVRSGQAPIAVAGGTEACLTVGTVKAWEALRALSTDTCRPFSKNRSGLVLGEGAAMFVLEPRDRALARGARVYAEILGFGMSADAVDITAADADGSARAMRAALRDARANPEDVDYVNAHGTGTILNDRTESEALQKVFGTRIACLPVSSSKAVLGHGMGAAGALELAATALALQTQTIPPTANFDEPDPTCHLDCVPNVARSARIRVAMSNSFAFGGLNAVLVLGRAS
ncbi:MAG TPA: beta-ketoacyl-[acyl-carrier-protein] synthase family protein [Steroidobacteraceae bacterium]|jgi:nodulation protein E|nr:beta-ketoacyl-[acyl-carrier-protein] synthase family protein [Steroidobacteraceae bacterium]